MTTDLNTEKPRNFAGVGAFQKGMTALCVVFFAASRIAESSGAVNPDVFK